MKVHGGGSLLFFVKANRRDILETDDVDFGRELGRQHHNET
jgi:hypothetical protein